MTIKNKLYLAFGSLFFVILTLGGLGSYYLRELARDSRAIIQNNYRTLQYMEGLANELNHLQSICTSFLHEQDTLEFKRLSTEKIEDLLDQQLSNITESGERKASGDLVESFESLFKKVTALPSAANGVSFYLSSIEPLITDIREKISVIYSLNEEALLQKNEAARNTAEKVVVYMTGIAGAALVTGLVFLLSLPVYISKLFSHFTEAISKVATGQYQQTIPVTSSDEFGKLAWSFNLMAERLSEYENSNLSKILFEKKRTEAIINSLHEPVIGLDENRNILFVNPPATELLGMDKEELTGAYAPDIAFKNELLRNLLVALMDPLKKGVDHPLKIKKGKKEQYYYKELVEIYVPGKDSQRLVGYVIILNDVTRFAEKDIAKTLFMATISHELKTPVAAIEMSAKLMANTKVGALNEEQQELLTTISSNNHRIQHMINEILDISKIESGYIDLINEYISPVEIMESALQAVQPFLEEKQLVVSRVFSRNLPKIKVDSHKLVWVINNLLTNAIRYSPEGGEIVAEAKKQQNRICLAIYDQGPGISQENQARIFEKFVRVTTDQSKGTGLGLAISKEFIKAMGGTIGVDSQVGSGSRFWVELPLDQ